MSLKVIGAGVGRTGTYSLRLAINHLGLGPCHHMEEVLHDQARQVPLWVDAVNGKADWRAIYEGYESAVDWPTAGFYRELVAAFPDQPFVIDHIAKPRIKDGIVDGWKEDMQAIAQYENVYCKISGMVTEANWKNWKPADFHPYLDTIVEAFGTGRILFGSDWPVCQVAGGYDKMMDIVKNYFASFSANEQALFFGGNAINFYQLK